MFLKGIESDKQKLGAYIKKCGYIENLGQIEYSEFRDKVNNSDLQYSEKANLCARYTEMLENI